MGHCKTCETFKFDFFGFKTEFSNPGIKSIIILIILMIFLAAAIYLCKQYVLPGMLVTGGGKALKNFIVSKIPFLGKGNKDGP